MKSGQRLVGMKARNEFVGERGQWGEYNKNALSTYMNCQK